VLGSWTLTASLTTCGGCGALGGGSYAAHGSRALLVVKRRSGGGLLGDEAALASELLRKKGTESDHNFLYTRFILREKVLQYYFFSCTVYINIFKQ
jgi:hypothetical protein